MKYKEFTYIIKVAELSSFTKAAEELYISQPALSHYIHKIEENLGAQIFNRSTNPISLTDVGKIYIQTGKEILDKIDSMQDGIKQINSHQKGTLKIGIPKSGASYMLPKIIPNFIEIYPNITLEFLERNSRYLKTQLLEGNLDFIIVPNLSNEDELTSINIYKEEIVLAVPEKLLNGKMKQTNTINDLMIINQLPLVILKKGHGIRNALDSLFDQFGIHPQFIMETTKNETAYRIASTGIAACIIPDITTKLVKEINKLFIFSLTDSGIEWQISALSRKDKHLTPPMNTFIEIAKEALKTE
jgi:DNA-binding transcriptional LysR family regulator